jgi:hypothetical protein
MSLASFINTPCTIIQRSGDTVDAYGDQTKTDTATASFCELQPSGAPREDEGGNIGVTTWRLYLVGPVALNADDAVQVDGEMYELVGDAEQRRNSRTGDYDHTVAIVRRVRDA